jgi:hypothetical protein
MNGTVATLPSGVEVAVLSFSWHLRSSSLPLAVEIYQRGFVRHDDKIRQLADDLSEYERLPSPKPPYSMAAGLLHGDKKRGKRIVIDGQQRFTAPCVLHQPLKKALIDQCAMTYSPRSARQIRCAARVSGSHSKLPDAGIVPWHDHEYTDSLFARFLRRARKWTGNRAGFGGHDALMAEFHSDTWPAGVEHDTVPLDRARHNRLVTALTVTREGHGEIHSNRSSLSPRAEALALAICQAIHNVHRQDIGRSHLTEDTDRPGREPGRQGARPLRKSPRLADHGPELRTRHVERRQGAGSPSRDARLSDRRLQRNRSPGE